MGGMETSTLRLARGLSEGGHAVKLIIHGGERHCHPLLLPQVNALPHEFVPTDLSDEKLAGLYADEAPAVVFPNQSAKAYDILRLAKCRYGADLRIFAICHSDHPDHYALAEANQDLVDIQFGVSRHMCEELNRRLSRPSRLLILGVDVPEACSRRSPHRRLEILYTGRIENYGKRCCELIPAGEALRERGVNFRMTIAGDGPYLKWLKRDDLKRVPWWARRHYRILGAVSPADIHRLYRESDIYLSFTRFEGNSIAVMEAMAQGCVPVLPRVSGTETVVSHRQNGWLGDVDRPETLIKACEVLYHDTAFREQLSVRAHACAQENFPLQNALQTVLGSAA